jgi:hypothetical protein
VHHFLFILDYFFKRIGYFFSELLKTDGAFFFSELLKTERLARGGDLMAGEVVAETQTVRWQRKRKTEGSGGNGIRKVIGSHVRFANG